MESKKKKIKTEMKNIQHPLFGISLKTLRESWYNYEII